MTLAMAVYANLRPGSLWRFVEWYRRSPLPLFLQLPPDQVTYEATLNTLDYLQPERTRPWEVGVDRQSERHLAEGWATALRAVGLDQFGESKLLGELDEGELGPVGADPGQIDIAQGRERSGMSQTDQQRVELEGQDRVAEGAYLSALLFESDRVEAIEAPEVEMDLLAGAVIDTSGGDHIPVAMAADGLRGEDHVGRRIIDTVLIGCVPTDRMGPLNLSIQHDDDP